MSPHSRYRGMTVMRCDLPGDYAYMAVAPGRVYLGHSLGEVRRLVNEGCLR